MWRIDKQTRLRLVLPLATLGLISVFVMAAAELAGNRPLVNYSAAAIVLVNLFMATMVYWRSGALLRAKHRQEQAAEKRALAALFAEARRDPGTGDVRASTEEDGVDGHGR